MTIVERLKCLCAVMVEIQTGMREVNWRRITDAKVMMAAAYNPKDWESAKINALYWSLTTAILTKSWNRVEFFRDKLEIELNDLKLAYRISVGVDSSQFDSALTN